MRALVLYLVLLIGGIFLSMGVARADEPYGLVQQSVEKSITKSGRWLRVDGEKLGKDASLSFISSNFGQKSSDDWLHYSRMKNAGIITTISGSVLAVTSGAFFAAYLVGGAIAGGIEGTITGSTSQTNELFDTASIFGYSCIVCTVAAGVGVVLWCVGDSHLRKMANGFNVAQIGQTSVNLSLGPQTHGIGIALNF
ncbi:MAG TPA: hypothetical protein DCW53_01735 [Rikenellaceae bacterium]|nr:hypothetical protein [Rikenellaceae bacterium]